LLADYSASKTIDLEGRVMLPGFVDSHTHIRGQARRFVDLTMTRSIEELQRQVRDKAGELGAGEWITGYGWSEDVLAEKRRPLRTDLDEAAPDNPVTLSRAGGHSTVLNSLALEMAGIYRNTPDPPDGVIERDEAGELNGIIREPGQMISQLVPPASDAELRDSLVAALKKQFDLGITSLVQAQDTIGHYAEWERIYEQYRGELPRAAVQVAWEGRAPMKTFGRRTADGDEFLRVGAVKIFVDGGFTGPAAYTKEPYKGEAEFRGKLNLPEAELRQTVRAAHDAGWQLGIHAIGDAAIELAVNELVSALEKTPVEEHRHYLNHFTVLPPVATMEKMAEYAIAITQQPNFTYTLEGRYVDYLDGDRLQLNNALRTPMEHGIHVAISSDILPIGPMRGIHAAVTRKGMSGEVYGAGEALGVTEALRGYTVKGAWLTFEEEEKGTIEEGKLADLIVLDRDILTIPADQIPEVRVTQTWLGGRLVYEARETHDMKPAGE
jgi:predicted amidohydrolase YtcJ